MWNPFRSFAYGQRNDEPLGSTERATPETEVRQDCAGLELALLNGLVSALDLVLSAYAHDELTTCLDRHSGYFKALIAQVAWAKAQRQPAGGPPTPDLAATSNPALRDGYYWVWYDNEWRLAQWDGEDWDVLGWGATVPRRHVTIGQRIADKPVGGPPTPDLAGQPDSTKNSLGSKERATPETEVRGESPFDVMLSALKDAVAHCDGWREFQDDATAVPFLPKILENQFRAAIAQAERSPTAHFTASPGTPDPPSYPYTLDATTWPIESPHQRIGVHDYDSLVACLGSNFETVFASGYAQGTDPQYMIQLMAAEIQNLRRDIETRRDNA